MINSPGSPIDWIKRAQGDLILAQQPLPEGAFFEDLCFHAQQAVEKALKAVYRHHNLPFQYTHDLAFLVTGLIDNQIDVPEMVQNAAILTTFAWQARYPGVNEPVEESELNEAVLLARGVVHWAAHEIGI